MSKISQIHDALISLIAGQLSTYIKLPNPYFIRDNNELFLKKGYGVAVGTGTRTDRLLSCQFSWQRDFHVVLTQLVTTTDSNTTQRETIVKNLLEDHTLVIEQIEKNTSLNGLCIRSEVVSDTGIQYLEGETGRYFVIEIDVVTEYLKDLTGG